MEIIHVIICALLAVFYLHLSKFVVNKLVPKLVTTDETVVKNYEYKIYCIFICAGFVLALLFNSSTQHDATILMAGIFLGTLLIFIKCSKKYWPYLTYTNKCIHVFTSLIYLGLLFNKFVEHADLYNVPRRVSCHNRTVDNLLRNNKMFVKFPNSLDTDSLLSSFGTSSVSPPHLFKFIR